MSENTNTTKRRSAIQIMGSLIGLVKPLLHIMRSEERRVGKEC